MIYTLTENNQPIELSKLGTQKPRTNIDKFEAKKIGKLISLKEIATSKGQDRKNLIKILTPYWTWTSDTLNNESCKEKFSKFKWAKKLWLSDFKDKKLTAVWSDWLTDGGCFGACANRPSYGNSYGLALFTKIYKSKKLGKIESSAEKICGNERPMRDVLCQLKKGHKGRHTAVIFWE